MIATRDAVREFAAGTRADLPPASGMPTVDTWKRTRFRQGAAFSKAHALLLARERPIDLLSGRPIDVGKALSWSNDKEYHHFFPQAYLKKQGYNDTAINAVANIIMLTSITNIKISDERPSEYLQEIIDLHGEPAARELCAASLVSTEAFDAALANDYKTFLKIRSTHLHNRVTDLIVAPPTTAL
jgi:hypothetical protein